MRIWTIIMFMLFGNNTLYAATLLDILRGDADITDEDKDYLFYRHAEAIRMKKERIKQNKETLKKLNLKIGILFDIINFLKEVNNIRVLGSCNKMDITNSAKIDCLFNCISSIWMITKFNDLGNIKQKNIINKIGQLVPNISNFIFLKFNKIIDDADKIAKYNKEIKRDLYKTKASQYSWLTLNKIIPYLGLIGSKSRYLKENQNFKMLKIISNISESIRRYYRYKAEMGDYRNHKPNN